MDSRRDRGGVGLVPAWLEIQGLSEESLRAAVTGLGIEILGALCARAEPPTVRVRLCCLAARKFTYTMYVELCRYMESCRAGRGSELTVVAGRGKPVEEPTGLPVEEPTGLPVEEPTGLPVEEPTGLPVEEPTGLPVEEPTGLPVEEPTGLPVEEPTGLPVEEPTGLPVEVLRIKVEAEESVSSEEERRNPENGVRRKLSKNFTCILCSRRLTTKANLINHMNRHQLVSGTNERTSEGEVEHMTRLERRREQHRARRNSETQEQRTARLAKQRDQQRARRSSESEEQRFIRLEKQREHQCAQRNSESEEQRTARLAKQREQQRAYRNCESEEQRATRLAKQRELRYAQRNSESQEQRTARLVKDRERHHRHRIICEQRLQKSYEQQCANGTANFQNDQVPTQL
uniref:C2H2-type domain-containing protein n=1 Tax=Eptatretus burgeri TaxID=7764 RepID=A0A8C4QIQ4_EPTBU